MMLKVAAFYQFAALPDFRQLREPLRAICKGLGLRGSVLLAGKGVSSLSQTFCWAGPKLGNSIIWSGR